MNPDSNLNPDLENLTPSPAPSLSSPDKLRSTANKIIYIIGGLGLAALIAVAVIFWIIPMFNNASGAKNSSSSNAGPKSSQQNQYEQCLKSGKSASDCLVELK